jgi:hypothetical protein
LRQGVLNVAGQTRLHEAFWFAQLAKQASELSAIRYFPIVGVFASAPNTVDRKKINTVAETTLIAISLVHFSHCIRL